MSDPIQPLIQAGVDALRGAAGARIAIVATSYDTDFEPIADQVQQKLDELVGLFDGTAIDWTLWIVDDRPAATGFGAAVQVVEHPRLRCVPIRSRGPAPGGFKGRAVLDGMQAALDADPATAALVYVNLNLKVDARQMGVGLRRVLDDDVDVAIGSRAPGDGGVVIGAGDLGRIKSRIFAGIARAALPPLDGYGDTNAPMKLFNAAAAMHLLRVARLDHVTLDVEWLTAMHAGGWRVVRFPIGWRQRPGSSPPWHLIALSLRDIARVRWWWKKGRYAR
ncbi:MAG: hypothetical protein ACI9U2_004371 [Bradymonadia bacterium]